MYNDVTSRNAPKQLRSLYVMAAHKNGGTQSFGIVSIFRFPATFWAMVIPSFRIPFHPIPFYPIPPYPIPSHPIQFDPVPSNPIQSNLI